MGTSKFGLIGIVGALFASATWAASVELVQEYSFQLPLTDTVRQIAFGDIDSDGVPEVLARTDHSFALYSMLNDSILFSQTYSADTFVTYVMLGDVNRDHVTDVVVGRARAEPVESFFFDITAFSGASNFATLGSYKYDIGGGAIDPQDSRIYFVKSIDIDNDGTDEVLFSWDQQWWNQDFSEVQSIGYSWLFHSFPDSVLWGKPTGLEKAVSFSDTAEFARILVVPRSYSGAFHQGQGGSSLEIAPTKLLAPNGDLTLVADYSPTHYYDPWCMYPDVWQIRTTPLCAGEISGNSDTKEYLALVDAQYGCWPALIQGHRELQLRRFNPNGINGIVWSLEDIYGYFAYHPALPGYFLSLGNVIYDGAIRARIYSGKNGSEIAKSVPLIPGAYGWVTDFSDSYPRIVVRQTNHVTVLSLNISTGVENEELTDQLPDKFTLGRPFPIPFNAEVTVPLSLPSRSELRVEVFNLLGQKVADLWNGPMNPGEQKIRWEAEKFPSAVYVVRAQTQEQTQTAKVVLLK